jgi:uncharacterized membrane protein YgcG
MSTNASHVNSTPRINDDDPLPLVPDNGDWWCIALYSCYIVTLCLVTYQIFLIVHYRHWGLQLGMLGSCALWLPLRIIFFMKITFVMHDWPLLLMLMLLNIPTCLLFTTFSILAIIFYGQILNWREWHLLSTHSCSTTCLKVPVASQCSSLLKTDCCRREVSLSLKKQYWCYWGIANLFVWILSIYGAYNSSREMASSRGNEDVRVGSVAAIYVVLAGTLAYHGYKFNQLSSQEYSQSLLPRSPVVFASMNMILCLSFVSRAVFEFIQISGFPVDLRVATIPLAGAHKKMYFGVFLLHFWWEILPTLVVVSILWKIPTHHRRKYKFRQPAPSPAGSSPGSHYNRSGAAAARQNGGAPVMGHHSRLAASSGSLPGVDSANLLQQYGAKDGNGGGVWVAERGGPGLGIGDAMIEDRINDPFKRSDSREILRTRQIEECRFEGVVGSGNKDGSWSIFDDPRRYDSPDPNDTSYLQLDDSSSGGLQGGARGGIKNPTLGGGARHSPREQKRRVHGRLASAPSAIDRHGMSDALDSSSGRGGHVWEKGGSGERVSSGSGSGSGSSGSGSSGGSGGGSSARTQGALNATRLPAAVDELTEYVSPRDVLQGLKDEYGGGDRSQQYSEVASRCGSKPILSYFPLCCSPSHGPNGLFFSLCVVSAPLSRAVLPEKSLGSADSGGVVAITVPQSPHLRRISSTEAYRSRRGWTDCGAQGSDL